MKWRVSAPAVFLGVTLWAVGGYVVFSGISWLFALVVPVWKMTGWCGGVVPQLLFWSGCGLTFLLLYLILAFYQRFCGKSNVFLIRWCVWLLTPLFLLVALLPGKVETAAGSSILFLGLILPLAATESFDRKNIALIIGNFLCWLSGGVILYCIWDFIIQTGGFQEMCLHGPDEPDVFHWFGIQRFWPIYGYGWSLFGVAGLLFPAGGYFLTAVLWAKLDQVEVRCMFGRGIWMLWSAAFGCWLFSAGMMLYAEKGEAQARQALELRFGRPPTAASLKTDFYRGRQPDPGYWKQIKAMEKRISAELEWDFGRSARPETFPPEKKERLRKVFSSSNWIKWEQAFAGAIPLEKLEFRKAEAGAEEYNDLGTLYTYSRLAFLWIQSAVEEGKAQEALYSCETMRNVCRHLENVAGPAYGNAWITCGQRRLDAMELLLKSGLCPAEQLRRWAAELRKMETLIPVMEERQLFAEAVTALDLFDMFTGEGGMISGAAGEYRPLPYRTLKFFLPQLWWYLTVDRTMMLQLYNVSDLREVSAERVRGGTYVYSGMSLTPGETIKERFLRLAARCRAVRELTAAELPPFSGR